MITLSTLPELKSVAAGMVIYGELSPARVGILGTIVARNSDNTLFGVTAAHLAPEGPVSSPGFPSPFGECEPSLAQTTVPGQRNLPIQASISLVRLHSAFPIDGGALPHEALTSAIVPLSALGQPVRKLTLAGVRSGGVLNGIEYPVHLRSKATQEIATYLGATEVIWSDLTPPFAGPGDAGAAIVSEDGDLIGIILGGAKDRCFVAPLKPLLDAVNMRIADAAAIAAHNARATEARSPVVDKRSAGKVTDKAGAANWPIVAVAKPQRRKTSARLVQLGYRSPTRPPDDRELEKLDRLISEMRPMFFPELVPLRNTTHVRPISTRQLDQRLLKIMKTDSFLSPNPFRRLFDRSFG